MNEWIMNEHDDNFIVSLIDIGIAELNSLCSNSMK